MRNSFPGVCYRCRELVQAGAGHFEKHRSGTTKWRVQHAECAIYWRGKPAPTITEAQNARQQLLQHIKSRSR